MLLAADRSVGQVDLDGHFLPVAPDDDFGHAAGVGEADVINEMTFVEDFLAVEFKDDVVITQVGAGGWSGATRVCRFVIVRCIPMR